MTGTIIAQAVGFAVSPIISRLYNQVEMSDLNLYMRAVSFISALATARFELSLPLPKNDSHSHLLYRLALKIALITLLASLIVGSIYALFVSDLFTFMILGTMVLVSSFFVVFINLGTNWSIRKGFFTKISYSRITNSLTSNGLRIAFGVWNWGSTGLVLGTMLGYMFSSFGFIREFLTNNSFFSKYKSKKKTIALATEYKEFPLIGLPHVLVDLGRDLLIAFLIITYFGKASFGSFGYSLMMLNVPIMIVGQAIGQVFFKKCTDLVNTNGDIFALLVKMIKFLLALSIVPFSILFFYGEPIFSFVFGNEWSQAGYYSEILSVFMFFNFLVSPLSNLPLILNRQKAYFFIGLFNTMMQLTILGLVPLFISHTNENFIYLLWIYSLCQSAVMVYTGIIFLKYAKLGKK